MFEVVPSFQSDSDVGAVVGQVRSDNNYDDTELQERRRLLAESFGIDLPSRQKDLMHRFLCDHHDVIVLSEGECGEIDLIQMDIERGDARPIKQHPRRMPYSAREEVVRQLKRCKRYQ